MSFNNQLIFKQARFQLLFISLPELLQTAFFIFETMVVKSEIGVSLCTLKL